MYQEVRRAGGIQRWPEVKEKKVKMRSKKQPLGVAKRRSLGRLGTESELRVSTGDGLGETLGRNGDS